MGEEYTKKIIKQIHKYYNDEEYKKIVSNFTEDQTRIFYLMATNQWNEDYSLLYTKKDIQYIIDFLVGQVPVPEKENKRPVYSPIEKYMIENEEKVNRVYNKMVLMLAIIEIANNDFYVDLKDDDINKILAQIENKQYDEWNIQDYNNFYSKIKNYITQNIKNKKE